MRVWAPGWMRALASLRAAAAYSVSMVSVDLPEPETPVTQVRRPMGISAVTFCRLFSVAPTMRIVLPFSGARRLVGSGICRVPERYCPVRLLGLARMSSGVPLAMTSPPWMPAPGPMSTT